METPALCFWADYPKLHSLDLSSTRITDDALINLETLEALTTLYLNHTAITDLEIGRLCHLRSLVALGLEAIKLQGDRLITIGCLKELRVLLLGHSDVTDQSIELIEKLSKLEELRLQYTKITEAALVQLRLCESLKVLHVEGCQIAPTVWENLTQERPQLTVYF